MVISGCMKQHLLIFTPNLSGFCKKYMFSCNCCLQFNSKEFLGGDVPLYVDVSCNDDYGDSKGEDGVLNKSEQIFDFLRVPSFFMLFRGNQNKPLYFVKVTEKETAHEDLTDFITSGEKYLKGFYLKMSRSK